MIFVQGWIRISVNDVQKAIPALTKMVKESLKEEGCLDYNFAQDVTEQNCIRLSERWATEDDLIAHFEMPHMAEFNSAVAGLTVEAVDVRMYSGEEVRIMMQS